MSSQWNAVEKQVERENRSKLQLVLPDVREHVLALPTLRADFLKVRESRILHDLFLKTKIGSVLCFPCFCFAPGPALNSS